MQRDHLAAGGVRQDHPADVKAIKWPEEHNEIVSPPEERGEVILRPEERSEVPRPEKHCKVVLLAGGAR